MLEANYLSQSKAGHTEERDWEGGGGLVLNINRTVVQETCTNKAAIVARRISFYGADRTTVFTYFIAIQVSSFFQKHLPKITLSC